MSCSALPLASDTTVRTRRAATQPYICSLCCAVRTLQWHAADRGIVSFSHLDRSSLRQQPKVHFRRGCPPLVASLCVPASEKKSHFLLPLTQNAAVSGKFRPLDTQQLCHCAVFNLAMYLLGAPKKTFHILKLHILTFKSFFSTEDLYLGFKRAIWFHSKAFFFLFLLSSSLPMGRKNKLLLL